jgi:hypothetical protein
MSRTLKAHNLEVTTRLLVCLACCAFAVATTAQAAEAPRQPAYPVFGILGVDPDLPGKAASLPEAADYQPIAQRQLIYSSDGAPLRAVRDAKRAIGASTPVLVYMGGFTTNPGGATEVEAKYRLAVAMIDATTLAAAIDAQSSSIRVVIPKDGELPITAATADRTSPNDKSKYCFWIRIDEELMKVKQADVKTGELVVERGFESTAAGHAAGAVVLTPVYLGNRRQLNAYRQSNAWPGARDPIRYALDPAAPAAQQFKADLITTLMQSGYDGAWLDTFQPLTFNLCDALGRKLDYPWDFRNHRRYDLDS